MNKKKVSRCLTLDDDVITQLKDESYKRKTNLSALINSILLNYLKENKK